MPQIVMDDGQVLEVGAFAGYRGVATERNGEPVCLLTLDFEVTGTQLGTYTQGLHKRITKKWDAEREERSSKLRDILEKGE